MLFLPFMFGSQETDFLLIQNEELIKLNNSSQVKSSLTHFKIPVTESLRITNIKVERLSLLYCKSQSLIVMF